MRNFLPALAGLLAIALAQPARAQAPTPCDEKGIRTNPAQATNPEYPGRTNTFNWDYGQQYNGRWWNLNSVAAGESAIWLPWEQSDNTNMTHILGKHDRPTDGWELLKRNLGFDDAGNPVPNLRNPYVILYNKRSAMLRVFVAVGERKQDYQFAEIKLLFNTGANKKAGTLNRLEGIGTALTDTPPGRTNSEFAAVARYLNDGTKWFMADFPMDYDPCACQFDSKLIIEVNLVSKATIQLTGVTTGTLMTTDVATKQTSTSTDFDKAIAMFKKVGTAIQSSQNTYKTISGYTSSVNTQLTAQGNQSSPADANNKKSAFAQLSSALNSSSFLRAGLSAVPYIGEAVSLLDSFLGGGKGGGSQSVSLQPMSLEMTTQLTGTIEASALFSTITFNNPGTRGITTAEEYPYYNEAMGVLSVLQRPVLELRKTTYIDADGRRRALRQYRVPEPLQYVINPASGLEVQDFQVAILQEGRNYPDYYPVGSAWDYEGLTSTGKHVMRSLYQDAGQLSEVYEMDISDERFQSQGSTDFQVSDNFHQIYLKLLLNLRVRNASPFNPPQNVLLVLKYPVTVRTVREFAPLSTPSSTGVLPQATAATVQSLCGSGVYNAAMNLRPAGITAPVAGQSAVTEPVAQLAPNPATDAVTLHLAGTHPTSAYLTDMLGRRVLTIMEVETVTQKTFSTAALAPGLYHCVLETADTPRQSLRLSIVR